LSFPRARDRRVVRVCKRDEKTKRSAYLYEQRKQQTDVIPTVRNPEGFESGSLSVLILHRAFQAIDFDLIPEFLDALSVWLRASARFRRP
jgi:hypothetical protein